MDETWLISQLKDLLCKYEDSKDKGFVYKDSADDERVDAPFIDNGRYFNIKEINGSVEEFRTEARRAIGSFKLGTIINYLYSAAVELEAVIPKDVEKRIENINKECKDIYLELIYSKVLASQEIESFIAG